MSEPDEVGGYWLVRRMRTGHGFGMRSEDQKFSDTVSADLWLQLTIQDTSATARHLAAAGVARCDEIEPLPETASAFWISRPASIVHLVSQPDAD